MESDLNTTNGDLELIFEYGNLDLYENVDVTAKGNFIILRNLNHASNFHQYLSPSLSNKMITFEDPFFQFAFESMILVL